MSGQSSVGNRQVYEANEQVCTLCTSLDAPLIVDNEQRSKIRTAKSTRERDSRRANQIRILPTTPVWVTQSFPFQQPVLTLELQRTSVQSQINWNAKLGGRRKGNRRVSRQDNWKRIQHYRYGNFPNWRPNIHSLHHDRRLPTEISRQGAHRLIKKYRKRRKRSWRRREQSNDAQIIRA